MSGERPVFYYDLNSPYAWLAAERVNHTLPEPPVWQPIAFAFILRHDNRTPWSMGPEKESGMREIERRAAERGLQELRWLSNDMRTLRAEQRADMSELRTELRVASSELRAEIRDTRR